MDNREWARLVIVEFLGSFALTFMAVGAIIQTQGNDVVAIALAYGLGMGVIVAAASHISGGFFNPALTIGLWATRRVDQTRAIVYIIAQCLGALAAAGCLTLVYRDLDRNAVNLGVPAVGHAILDTTFSLSAGNALVMEIVLTFFLMFVVFGTAIDNRTVGRAIAGLAIGFTITMGVLAGNAVSGAAMNPARWFGPAVIQGDFSDFWIWILGPIVGAVAAAVLYNDVILARTASSAAPIAHIDAEHPHAAVETEVRQEIPVRSRRSQRRGR